MRVYLATHIQHDRFASLLEVSEHEHVLDDKNVEIVDDISGADVMLFLINSRTNMKNLSNEDKALLKNSRIPVILLERFDSSVSWFREFDEIPNLKAIIKNRLIDPVELMNSEYYFGRYHYRLMYDAYARETLIRRTRERDLSTTYYPGLMTLPVVSKENLSKFHHVLWDFNSSPLSRACSFFRESNIDFEADRDIDVFCVNNDKKGIQGWMRKKAKKIVNGVRNINSATEKMPFEEYNNALINSKVAIACWGWGEWVHMDASALYGGTILIKPDTGFVRMFPEIYLNNETYLPCKPDFSDLEKTIRTALDNYDNYLDMRKKNRAQLLDVNPKQCAELFWDKVYEILD